VSAAVCHELTHWFLMGTVIANTATLWRLIRRIERLEKK